MDDTFVLGWEEWVTLPVLGLPAMKTKVDTGARTSALHAFDIEPFGREDRPMVRFGVHPVPGDNEIEVYCSAPVVDRREVTSSNGDTELRFVIETMLQIADRSWPIEVTLTNRDAMSYRMLLGRRAISEDMVVNPGLSFQQPELSFDDYRNFPRRRTIDRPLRICLLTREPDNYSSCRLKEAAEARGHTLEMIDTSRCYMSINALAPAVHYDGKKLPRYDAVIPRIGSSMTFYGMAVMRQFQMMGSYCVNSADAIGASRDKLFAHQILAKHRIEMPATAFAHSPKDTKNLIDLIGGSPLVLKLLESAQGKGVVLAETKQAAESVVSAFRRLEANFLVQEFVKEAAGSDVRCLVIGNRVVAAMKRSAAGDDFRSNLHQGGAARSIKLKREERQIAVRAAKAMQLSVAGVDILQSNTGPKVLEVNSSPGLQGIERVSELDIAGLIIDFTAENVRSVIRRRGTKSFRPDRKPEIALDDLPPEGGAEAPLT